MTLFRLCHSVRVSLAFWFANCRHFELVLLSGGRVCKERKSLSCELNALLSAGNGESSVVVATAGRLVDGYLVDPASSHMLVSKTKPCMSKYKRFYTVKLRMAH